jgi:uncharacterized membrane protein
MHLPLVHFPIALVLTAVIGECLALWRRSRVPSPTVRLCIAVAAGLAVPTVAYGWVLARDGHGASSPDLLSLHRWVGTTAGVWLLALGLCSEIDARRKTRSLTVRLLLFSGAALVGLAGHLGGLLVHGEDFFAW